MKLINVALSMQEKILLSQIIGTKILSFRCDPFTFNNWVYQCVGVIMNDCCLILKNETHPADFYGIDEDVCWFEVIEAKEEDVSSGLANVQQIDIPYNEVVEDICLIQESQKLKMNGEEVYNVKLTRGVIFCFADGREICFEKTDPFSEEIEIRRGHALIGSFVPKNDPDEWENGAEMVITQKVEHLNPVERH